MYTIYDNESEINYLKLTPEAIIFTYLLSNFPHAVSEANVSLNNQTQPGDVLRHD